MRWRQVRCSALCRRAHVCGAPFLVKLSYPYIPLLPSQSSCAALPLVNNPGTSIACTTAADRDARIAAVSQTYLWKASCPKFIYVGPFSRRPERRVEATTTTTVVTVEASLLPTPPALHPTVAGTTTGITGTTTAIPRRPSVSLERICPYLATS